jgi:osmotically-inducible protein OsmY
MEEIIRELTYHPRIDATHIEVTVQDGEVTLAGMVEDREMRRLAEDTADSVSGVRNVYNSLRITSSEETDGRQAA